MSLAVPWLPSWQAFGLLGVASLVLPLVGLAGAALLRRASPAARHAVLVAALGGILVALVAPRVLPSIELTIAAGLPSGDDATPLARAPGDVALRLGLAALWLAGALGLLLRDLLAVGARRRLLAGTVAHGDPALAAAVTRVARELGIHRPVTVRLHADATTAMIWGTLRPVLLLPARYRSWSGEEREAVLRHELAHVARGDALTDMVARLAVALVWFQPLAWRVHRRARAERELACDAVALARGMEASRYAEFLVLTAASRGRRTRAVLALAQEHPLEGRVAALLDGRAARAGAGAWTRLLVVTMLVATAAASSTRLVTVAAESRDAPRPAATPGREPVVPDTRQTAAHRGVETGEPPARMVPADRGKPRPQRLTTRSLDPTERAVRPVRPSPGPRPARG